MTKTNRREFAKTAAAAATGLALADPGRAWAAPGDIRFGYAAITALNEVKFRGWAIVELDAVPDKARTPHASALIAKQYLQQLGFTV